MTTRTFIQKGQAYGSQPVTIIAKINGIEFFNNTVQALNQPVVSLPAFTPFEIQDLFTWENSIDFNGTQEMEITVAGGTVLLTQTVANYNFKKISDTDWSHREPGGVDYYDNFYHYQDSDGRIFRDPFTNISINDVSYQQDGILPGQWYWKLNSGDAFKATLNVLAGVMPIA